MNAESSPSSNFQQLFELWSTMLCRNFSTNSMCLFLNLPQKDRSTCLEIHNAAVSRWYVILYVFFSNSNNSLIFDLQHISGQHCPKMLFESHVLLPLSETDNGSTSMKIQEITVSCWETIIQLCSNSSIFSSSTDLRCQFEVMNAESSIFSKLHQFFDPWSTVLSRNVFTNRMCSYFNLPRSIDLLLWKSKTLLLNAGKRFDSSIKNSSIFMSSTV